MKKVTILTVILLLIAASAAFAQHGRGFRGKGDCGQERGFGHKDGQGMLLRHAEALALTDDQITRIKDLGFNHKEALIDLQAEMKKLKLNMHREMTADNPDKDKVLSYTREMNKVKGQIAEMKVEHKFAVAGILTDEQKTKIKEMKMKGSESKGHGRRGMHGMGDQQGGPRLGMRLQNGTCVSGR